MKSQLGITLYGDRFWGKQVICVPLLCRDPFSPHNVTDNLISVSYNSCEMTKILMINFFFFSPR